ncbi:MAG TPA: tRNA (adenosine(37)-N6)-dimethylallyltransferase MiaA [Ignavibacteriales bacterium]|nr:tRNA (adenosine(37)-N6)-dimethylallyltransferase MiaA [Ignavibacteriales bacterium]HOL81692.1 tRNA (adenosine(37)-N6)-dimethylallyltransferase MiaA [Ignavibacteriales bacterium]HOM65127.1 tRNA (adenosine(37)-N6)-dimethylallyltransferase MiaA [Ignavibacteriales bacterium]HPD66851.1 tRNA (adenosine(37)-N6)-dimethylallyltransferase MiaA [Ignavibacteriales bacterium]HPP33806.1 tRNA (adenosine(37)-N6)-dimethylallyltransferase MiaA [Ignavibacteriales bacterium]
MKYDLITILGPTAIGKTSIAIKLALKFNGEIISADSRQVYKYMDIGTGKDLNDFIIDQKTTIPYYIIDVCHPNDDYNLFKFKKDFDNAYSYVKKKGKIPFLVGGTGLFLNAILSSYHIQELDFNAPEYQYLYTKSSEELKKILFQYDDLVHNKNDYNDRDRMIKRIIILSNKNKWQDENKINSLTIGIFSDREDNKKRITERLKYRLQNGMIDEVKKLLEMGITHKRLFYFGLEYRYISLYLQNKLNYNDMYQKLNSQIHKFAKRQMTWFRKMEREGIIIHWFHPDNYDEIEKFVSKNII